MPDGRVIFPLLGNLDHNVLVFVRVLKVIGKLVIHHAARDETASVEVIERFVFTEIRVELDNRKLAAAFLVASGLESWGLNQEYFRGSD